MRAGVRCPAWEPTSAGGRVIIDENGARARGSNACSTRMLTIFGVLFSWQLLFGVTAKHPPNFERKMASHRAGRLGRFLFVRDAIRFRSVHGLVEDGAATKKRGVLGSYQS